MAPEVLSGGAASLSERSDVFSFGVLLLELVCGKQPMDASLPAVSAHARTPLPLSSLPLLLAAGMRGPPVRAVAP